MKRYQKCLLSTLKLTSYIPLIILGLVLGSLVLNAIKINFADPIEDSPVLSQITSVRKTFDTRDVKIYSRMLNRTENRMNYSNNTFTFYNVNSAGYYESGTKKFLIKDKNKVIFVFGASSTVAPTYDEVFSKLLENKIDNNYTIINFGMDGIRSDIIKLRVYEALEIVNIKPQAIMIYSGHNEYDASYWLLRQRHGIIKNTIILNKMLSLLNNADFSNANFKKKLFDNYEQKPIYIPYHNNVEWVVEPTIKKLFEGKLIFSDNPILKKNIQRFNDAILTNYAYNIGGIIARISSEKIPLIFITPISNLESESYGSSKMNSLFSQNVNEPEYSKRITALIKTKDNEIYSPHMRAKSNLIEYVKSIEYENVYVYDLETELQNEKFNFTYQNFYDSVHMRPKTHEIIASKLFQYIEEERIIEFIS